MRRMRFLLKKPEKCHGKWEASVGRFPFSLLYTPSGGHATQDTQYFLSGGGF